MRSDAAAATRVVHGSDAPGAESVISGVVVRDLVHHEDPRGNFTETYRDDWFPGLPAMMQGNRSDSRAGVIRGLHFHRRQADWWVCLAGRITVCLHDLRASSPSRATTEWWVLDGTSSRGIYIPPGVAHGFCAEIDSTLTYMVDQPYDASDEFGVHWNDPQIAMPWPVSDPIVSDRDRTCGMVADLSAADLPE